MFRPSENFISRCFPVFIFLPKKIHRNKSHEQVAYESIEKGEALAALYCQSCHLLPNPDLVSSSAWETGVLPNMGPRLGIFFYNFQRYPSNKNDQFLDKNFYPAKPLLSLDQWQNIIDYYTATSPDSMPGQNRKHEISKDLPLFKIETPAFLYPNSVTSYIKIDSPATHRLIISDVVKQTTFF